MVWLFQAWLPGYLEIQRHMSIRTTGFVAAIPYAFGVVGSICGHTASDQHAPAARDRRRLAGGDLGRDPAGSKGQPLAAPERQSLPAVRIDTLSALEKSGLSPSGSSLVPATTVRAIAGAAGGVCAAAAGQNIT
jgi:transcription antitermination factor NusG